MKYSYRWLKELSGTKKSPQKLAEFLTMRAFEVESIEKTGFDIEGVVIGIVEKLEKHPNADRLQVAQVNIGRKILNIVCGAPNVAEGQKVAVATIGTRLADDVVIKKMELLGVASEGMICSEKELGRGDPAHIHQSGSVAGRDHSGIWVLPENAPVGTTLAEYLGTDFLLDIKVLPDRAHDCLSHVGMAREIAALEYGKLDYDYDGLKLPRKTDKDFSVEIAVPEKSHRYIGVLLKNVSVSESPVWLRRRLELLGARSINTVVDITNYVMLELGEPMHAFDWDKLVKKNGQAEILVRFARSGEKIKLLDEKEYTLTANDLVIADSEKAIALAGIMGGADTAVTSATKHIFLEAANFDAATIRRSRLRHGLRTDASDWFEKNLNPSLAERTMARALDLLQHTAKGGVAGVSDVYPVPHKPRTLTLHSDAVEKLLGVAVPLKKVIQALQAIGCGVSARGGSASGGQSKKTGLTVTVPEWRVDIENLEDLIEEIGRAVGYDTVPSVAPKVFLQAVELLSEKKLERRLQDFSAANGLAEVYNYSFYSEETARACTLEKQKHLELENPMNPEQALMRVSLLPGLLKNVRDNAKYFKEFSLFELGRVYLTDKSEKIDERKMWAAVSLASGERDSAFFALKGTVERLLGFLGIRAVFDTASQPENYWHPTRVANIGASVNGTSISLGQIGEIHPFILERFKIKKPIIYCEIRLDALIQTAREQSRFELFRKFPVVLRDLSLFVPGIVSVKMVQEIIKSAGGETLIGVELFDRYEEEETRRVSLAFHLSFGANDRTLSGEEVEVVLDRILATLKETGDIEVRR